MFFQVSSFMRPMPKSRSIFQKSSDSERAQELARLATTLIVRLRETKRRLDAEAAKPATLLDGPPEPAKLFLHANRARLQERDAIKAELERDGFNPVTIRLKATVENDLGQDERKSQIRWLKQCDALALTSFDGGEDDEREFEYFLDNRKDIINRLGKPLPWVVIDRSGGALPFDPRDFQAARIDATRADWRDELRSWLDGACGLRA